MDILHWCAATTILRSSIEQPLIACQNRLYLYYRT